MNNTFFICPAVNCAYAIDSERLNQVQLKVLRRTAKRCPGCGNLAQFIEQTSLPNIQTKTKQTNGGFQNEKATQATGTAIPSTASQRRQQARRSGSH